MKEQRLIDANKIKPMDFPSYEMDGLDVVRYLGTLPTVDAVEVVRCKDCRHFATPQGVPCCDNFFGLGFPRPSGDDFCSYGERRTDGSEG